MYMSEVRSLCVSFSMVKKVQNDLESSDGTNSVPVNRGKHALKENHGKPSRVKQANHYMYSRPTKCGSSSPQSRGKGNATAAAV